MSYSLQLLCFLFFSRFITIRIEFVFLPNTCSLSLADRIDFTACGMFIWVSLIVLIMFGILAIIFQNRVSSKEEDFQDLDSFSLWGDHMFCYALQSSPVLCQFFILGGLFKCQILIL